MYRPDGGSDFWQCLAYRSSSSCQYRPSSGSSYVHRRVHPHLLPVHMARGEVLISDAGRAADERRTNRPGDGSHRRRDVHGDSRGNLYRFDDALPSEVSRRVNAGGRVIAAVGVAIQVLRVTEVWDERIRAHQAPDVGVVVAGPSGDSGQAQ